MSEKSKKFKSPGFDKRSSRTKNGLLEMNEAEDNILDEHIEGSLTQNKMTSLDS